MEKIHCKCGWSWNKSDSDPEDLWICHKCNWNNDPKLEINRKTQTKTQKMNKHVKLYEEFVGEKFNSDDIFFIWDDTVDDDRAGISAGNRGSHLHRGKSMVMFDFDVDAKKHSAFMDFKKKAIEYLEKNRLEYEDMGDQLFVEV